MVDTVEVDALIAKRKELEQQWEHLPLEIDALQIEIDELTQRTPYERGIKLSGRQYEVLQLLQSGPRYGPIPQNKEIGAKLFIAERTVKHHIGILLAKFKKQNRGELRNMRKVLMVLLLLVPTVHAQAPKATATWVASTTPTVTQYAVYRDNVPLATTPALSYEDATLVPGATYTYHVTSMDGGVESIPSNLVTVTVPGTPPPPPPPQTGCVTSTRTVWTGGTFFPAQAGRFEITYDATPTAAGTDAVFGLFQIGPSGATGYNLSPATVRFFTNNRIDARNAGVYTATSIFAYSPGVTYRFRWVVDMTTRRYDVFVTAPGGVPVQIAANFAFRSTTEANAITQVDRWATLSAAGGQSVCNVLVTPLVTPPPPPPPPPTTDITYTFTKTVTQTVTLPSIIVPIPPATVSTTLICTVTVPTDGSSIRETCVQE